MSSAIVDNASFRRSGSVGVDQKEAWGSRASGATRTWSNSVVVVDERQLIVDALAALLDGSGRFTVTTCSTGDRDLAAIAAIGPDLVLVGVGELDKHLLRFVESLHRLAPEVRTVIVADSKHPDLIRCVLQQRAAALVLTAGTGEDLALTLDYVLHGHTALPDGWQGVLADCDEDPVSALSSRQLEVLRLLADGYTYEEISARLIITVNTVKFHVRSIYLNLGVSGRMAAAKVLEASPSRHAYPVALTPANPTPSTASV